MKIAFVGMPWSASVAPAPPADSIAICTYELARRVSRHHKVLVYGKREWWQRSVQRYQGMEYRRVSLLADQLLLKLLKPLARFFPPQLPLFASPLFYLFYSLQVAIDLRRQHCDMIHVQCFSQFVPLIRWLNPRAKIVLNVHDEWLVHLDEVTMTRRVQQTNLVVGCSDHITARNRSHFPEYGQKFQTVSNGVDLAVFQPPVAPQRPRSNPRLIFVGRVSPEKGLHVLLQAFERVLQGMPEVELEIIGPPGSLPPDIIRCISDDARAKDLVRFCQIDYLNYLRSQLSPLAAQRVTFAGLVERSQLAAHYSRADLLVNPSFVESFGMSLLEGMALNLPVVATRVGGMTGVVVEGQTGLMVEPGDAAALAEALLTLLANPELGQTLGQAGRQRVLDCFSWDSVADSLLMHYYHLLGYDPIALPQKSREAVL